MRNNTNKGIACNVKGCIFNEGGQGCNLDKVKISKGEGNQHFCKSFISLQDENEYNFSLDSKTQSSSQNVESSKEYFDFGELMNDIKEKLDD